MEQDDYQAVIEDGDAFRAMLDKYIVEYPTIFLPDIAQGYKLNGWVTRSAKIPDVRMRMIVFWEPLWLPMLARKV